MDTLAQRLDKKLQEWEPEVASQVLKRVSEFFEVADQGLLDVVLSRRVEQDVLDMLDESSAR
jgi:hypothetical protein